ncbi:MAG: peptidylprolyl isomerase [Bacteroidetes bacterium]|nr:peptidylprolyl isomerase [Bacteroidota bacterium]
MKKVIILLTALVAISGSAFAQKKEKKEKVKLSKEDKEFLAKQAEGIYAKFETNRGLIYTLLEYKKMPMTVSNFVGLAEGTIKNTAKAEGVPYYNGVKFHRIIPGFMIQGGCPLGNGSGDPGYAFADEMDKESELAKKGYVRGTLAMANRGPNTNGSQFFIIHKDYPLPPSYTIFGNVVKGIEVVDSIINSPRNGSDLPLQDQTITSITILRKGKEAETFNAAKTFETAQAELVKKIQEKQNAEKAAFAKMLAEKFPTAKVTASGLAYITEKEGEGANPTASSSVTVHYTGTLLDGKKFDSSLDKGQPITFPLNRVIPGWTEGIQLMKKGGKIKLIIPPNLGYGSQNVGGGLIPPNSTLVFDVELISF